MNKNVLGKSNFFQITVAGLMAGLIAGSAVSISTIGHAVACTEDGKEGIVPENDRNIPVGAKEAGGLNEAQFNQVLTEVETVLSPIVASKGGKLVIQRKWTDGTVNAYAKRQGRNWIVAMFGGLARHPLMTIDGMAAVVCHEIGHHIGGAPIKAASSWAANEGQADYFAMLKCLRLVYGGTHSPREWTRPATIPATVVSKCSGTFRAASDVTLCERTSIAGQVLGNIFADLKKGSAPTFDTPDTSVVTSTDDDHPAPQCRLDTYFAGSVCGKDVSEDVSNTDVTQGTCSVERGDTVGVRPACWYKAEI